MNKTKGNKMNYKEKMYIEVLDDGYKTKRNGYQVLYDAMTSAKNYAPLTETELKLVNEFRWDLMDMAKSDEQWERENNK